MADDGITYTLGGDRCPQLFEIDAGNGIGHLQRPARPTSTTDPHHIITITATDKGGNPDTIDCHRHGRLQHRLRSVDADCRHQ